MEHWLKDVDEWQIAAVLANQDPQKIDLTFYELWSHTQRALTDLLRDSRMSSAAIPQSGGLLLFVGGLAKCIVVTFAFTAETPNLKIVAVLDDPRSTFDFWSATDQAAMAERSDFKDILTSGQKVVVHRGILVHVDRRIDQGVFGPSIDTLVMNEILAQDVFEQTDKPIPSALDVGSGNGMLAASIIRHATGLRELFAFDIHTGSVACTDRNCMRPVRLAKRRDRGFTAGFMSAQFDPGMLNRQFDLVVCNPPYIPVAPAIRAPAFRRTNLYEAVGDTSLLKLVVSTAPSFLKVGGRLLVMTSSLSLAEALRWVPDGLRVTQPLGETGFEVPFDVEAVLKQPEWLGFCRETGGVEERGEMYFHRLHPLWIERTE
jgi:tRNA1(Val) A37 N6-methylase TrmN6